MKFASGFICAVTDDKWWILAGLGMEPSGTALSPGVSALLKERSSHLTPPWRTRLPCMILKELCMHLRFGFLWMCLTLSQRLRTEGVHLGPTHPLSRAAKGGEGPHRRVPAAAAQLCPLCGRPLPPVAGGAGLLPVPRPAPVVCVSGGCHAPQQHPASIFFGFHHWISVYGWRCRNARCFAPPPSIPPSPTGSNSSPARSVMAPGRTCGGTRSSSSSLAASWRRRRGRSGYGRRTCSVALGPNPCPCGTGGHRGTGLGTLKTLGWWAGGLVAFWVGPAKKMGKISFNFNGSRIEA